MSKNAIYSCLNGLLIGGIIGLVAGWLTAPKRGADLRKELSQNTEDLLREINDQIAELNAIISTSSDGPIASSRGNTENAGVIGADVRREKVG